jgi:tRNA (guanine-N7-)-methyltransferase
MQTQALQSRGNRREIRGEIEFVPGNYFKTLSIDSLFTRQAPLQVDLGCGGGSFLLEMARRYPDQNFLGIERLAGRVDKVCRRAARLGLGNVRILRIESAYAVRHMLPPASVSILHIAFPDPWPKRRHHHRRLINTEFLAWARRTLCADGEIRLTTDDADYFAHMQRAVSRQPGLREVAWLDETDYPRTDFEKVFRVRGLAIHRLLLWKV